MGKKIYPDEKCLTWISWNLWFSEKCGWTVVAGRWTRKISKGRMNILNKFPGYFGSNLWSVDLLRRWKWDYQTLGRHKKPTIQNHEVRTSCDLFFTCSPNFTCHLPFSTLISLDLYPKILFKIPSIFSHSKQQKNIN